MAVAQLTTPKIVFGTGNWGSPDSDLSVVTNRSQAEPFLELLKNHNVTTLDTSRIYPLGAFGSCEVLLGEIDAPASFAIDTKISGATGAQKSENVIESIDSSLKALGVKKVGIMYLHFPDRTVPLSEPLKALDQAHKQGKFERFGLSNHSAAEVEEIAQICEKKGYVKPSVYQGQYNALYRRGEKQLLPTLRANNIAFYAYSPTAGGAFNANSTRLNRQDMIGDLTRSAYRGNKTAFATEVAQRFGITGHELALHWVLYHSAISAKLGDAIILGASRPTQIEQSLQMCGKGPLPDEVVKAVDDIWASAEAEATSYSPWVDVEGNPLNFPVKEVFTE